VGFNTGGNTLQFLAVAGRDYTIQFRTNAGTGAWTKLQDVPAAPTNTLTTVTDPNISGVSAKFYRLVIPE
jgi:hypothetical protein